MRTVPLLIMLAVASITGSLPSSSLLAAEPVPGNAPPAQESASAKTGIPEGTTDKSATDAAAQAAEGKVAEDKSGEDRTAAEKPAPEKPAAEKPEPAKSAADKAASPQRFIPSEQVRADFDVSFPIDI